MANQATNQTVREQRTRLYDFIYQDEAGQSVLRDGSGNAVGGDTPRTQRAFLFELDEQDAESPYVLTMTQIGLYEMRAALDPETVEAMDEAGYARARMLAVPDWMARGEIPGADVIREANAPSMDVARTMGVTPEQLARTGVGEWYEDPREAWAAEMSEAAGEEMLRLPPGIAQTLTDADMAALGAEITPAPPIEGAALDLGQITEVEEDLLGDEDDGVDAADDEQRALTEIAAVQAAGTGTTEGATDEFVQMGQRVQQSTIIFDFSFKAISFRKKVKNTESILADDVKVAADQVSASQQFLDCDELDQIKTLVKKFKRWLRFRRLDCSVIRGGMYLVPLAKVQEVEAEYARLHSQFYPALRALVSAYAQRVNEQEAKTPAKLFDRRNFPTARQVARTFRVRRQWLPFDAPQALQSINVKMWEQQAREMQVQLGSIAREAEANLQSVFAEYVAWLADRLTPKAEGGKRKAIAEAKLEDMRTFLAEFQHLNLTGNEEMARLVEMGRQAMDGISTADVKKNDATRESLRATFAQLQEQTQGWIVEQSRIITSEEEI